MRVLVTGATGLVGRSVVKKLLAQGFEVSVLTRNIAKAALSLGSQCKFFLWPDTTTPPPAEAFEGVDGVVNLMGEGIADKRWDDDQKKKIHDSRIVGTAQVLETIKGMARKPKVLVSASAVGIYGNRENEEITEESSLGNDFLANLCKEWEEEALKARELGLRVVLMRTGVALGNDGGALKKMLLPFKLGLGGPIGSGKQYLSWIHVDDLGGMYVEALKDPSFSGPVNGTAPYPATNSEFSQKLGKALGKPAILPAPGFAIKLIFGEMSQVLLEGQRVLPVKFKAKKFRFEYPTLEMALKETAF